MSLTATEKIILAMPPVLSFSSPAFHEEQIKAFTDKDLSRKSHNAPWIEREILDRITEPDISAPSASRYDKEGSFIVQECCHHTSRLWRCTFGLGRDCMAMKDKAAALKEYAILMNPLPSPGRNVVECD